MSNDKLQFKWGQEVGVDTVAIEPGQILLTKDKGKLYIDVPGDTEGQGDYRVRVNAFHADTASHADSATQAEKASIADAVSGSLIFDFGGRADAITYTGKDTTTINWKSLGLAPALHFLGVIASGKTLDLETKEVELPGKDEETGEDITKIVEALLGDVVIYGQKEYVWTGTAWVELGDESAYALKSTNISGDEPIIVSGSLYNTDNQGIVIQHQKPIISKIDNDTIKIDNYDNSTHTFDVHTITQDIYGHITGVTKQPVQIKLPSLQALTINQNDANSNITNLTYNPSTGSAALKLSNMSGVVIKDKQGKDQAGVVQVRGGLVPSSPVDETTGNPTPIPAKSALLANGTWGQPDIFWGTF